MAAYGMEVLLDLYDCSRLPCNRGFIESFLGSLCDLIGMEAADLHFWDYEGDRAGYNAAPPHLKGISAVQFIQTSTIVVHTIDVPRTAYVNVFSCGMFDSEAAVKYCWDYFGAASCITRTVERR